MRNQKINWQNVVGGCNINSDKHRHWHETVFVIGAALPKNKIMSSEFHAYKRRWIYLFVACLVNFSNGNTWITYAPITFQTNDFYGNSNAALLFNLIFMALSIPVGFLSCWWTDRYGLRSAILASVFQFHIGAWTNFIGNVIRVAGSGEWFSKNVRFPMAFTGQAVAAFAQPFVMFLPTKLAAFWFPPDQRVIANTLSSMSNPIGIAVMYSISPLIVNESHPNAFPLLASLNVLPSKIDHPKLEKPILTKISSGDLRVPPAMMLSSFSFSCLRNENLKFCIALAIRFQTGVCAGLATVTAVFTLFITRSKPPTPVAASRDSEVEVPGFLEGVKLCARSKTYWVLAVCLGGGVGLFNALYNNLQPALCVLGYSASFSGGMGTLLIMSGLVGAAITGIYVDMTGQFEKTMKVSFLLAGIAACSLAVSINYEAMQGWVVASIFLFGAFGFAIYPIGLEMGSEDIVHVLQYRVCQSTRSSEAKFFLPFLLKLGESPSTGIASFFSQVQGVIYVILTNIFVGQPDAHELAVQTCVDKNSNLKTVVTWSVPFLIWAGGVCLLIILFVGLFWPKYKRRDYEAQAKRDVCGSVSTYEERF
ncbi:unnamed protein product [Strongylus vulgaris]|uniref:Major facilitator superfamily (MFS) profile domain-containing protein n=1 Tax=Strongylus vulgaris TaxID=40348 RepID=A0A3P7IXZ7_STRVU|nr:unnamed protein product [Strongylus vulgaris]